MNETLKKAANKIKNPKFLLIAGLAGILLIALSSFTGNKEKAAKNQASSGISAEEYKAELESGVREIRGVAVVCRGGDDELINEKIKNAVTAALNITSKRVYIAGGTDNEKR